MPRAGRPVKILVRVVLLSCACFSAARCSAEVLASGVSRKAVPICTPAAPSASAATMPRPSPMPPAAITGTFTASTTCGTSAIVPAWRAMSSFRNMPRWPPASLPWAMTASQPCPSSQRASSADVAELMTSIPASFTRLSSAASGMPKWKLTTLGLNSSTTSHIAAVNGARVGAFLPASAARPSSR